MADEDKEEEDDGDRGSDGERGDNWGEMEPSVVSIGIVSRLVPS